MLELAISIVATVIVLYAIVCVIAVVGGGIIAIIDWLTERIPDSPKPSYDPNPSYHWTSGTTPTGWPCRCGLCSQQSRFRWY